MPQEVRVLRWPTGTTITPTTSAGANPTLPWGTFAAARTAALDEKIQQEVQQQPRMTQVRGLGASWDAFEVW